MKDPWSSKLESSPGTCLILKIIIVSRPQKLAAVRGTTLYTEYTPVSQPNGRLPAHYLFSFFPPVITTASYQSGDITKRVHFILFALWAGSLRSISHLHSQVECGFRQKGEMVLIPLSLSHSHTFRAKKKKKINKRNETSSSHVFWLVLMLTLRLLGCSG